MSSTPTILRIKRRRRDDHEALDALVIESPARPVKKSKSTGDDDLNAVHAFSNGIIHNSSKGVFRFAETVGVDAFSTETSKRSLRERITSLLAHPAPRLAGATHISRTTGSNGSSRESPRQSRFSTPTGSTSALSALSSKYQQAEAVRRHARYRIIEEKRASGSYVPAASYGRVAPGLTAPPIVRSTAAKDQLPTGTEVNFRILEAAIESDDDDASTRNLDPIQQKLDAYTQNRRQRQLAHRYRQMQQTGDSHYSLGSAADQIQSTKVAEDDQMDVLMPMLQEYLSLQPPQVAPAVERQQVKSPFAESIRPSAPLADESLDNSPPHPGYRLPPDLSSGDAVEDESEWVYDVYYRDSTAVLDSIATALPGLQSGVDVGSAGGLRRIGQLTGLQDDELLDADLEDADSDAHNTDDEDSNEEDFYRNDYPEGEEDEVDNDVDDISNSSEGDYSL